MSMFYCVDCGTLADSDYGSEESKSDRFGLICIDCINERQEELDEKDAQY